MNLFRRCVVDFVVTCIDCMNDGRVEKRYFQNVLKTLSLFNKRYNVKMTIDEYNEYNKRFALAKDYILNDCADDFHITVTINAMILLVNDLVEEMVRPKEYGRLLDVLVEFYQIFDPEINFYNDIDYGCEIGERLKMIFQGQCDTVILKECINV